ncbi:Glycine receptor subunit alpha-3 [Mactra antiquata]
MFWLQMTAMTFLPFIIGLEEDVSAKLGVRSARSSNIPISIRQETLDKLLEKYDPRIAPNYEEDFPVKVLVQLHITNIDEISESAMEFNIGMFLRQTWNDSRLVYEALPNLRSLELDTKFMDRVWVPDLFILNEKRAHFHTITVPNKLMHIYPEGRVQYSIRISATLKCEMDLRKYPLDSQRCAVVMESYGYSTENLMFYWHPTPYEKDPRLTVSQFFLGNFENLRCQNQYNGVNYSCVVLEFEVTRSLGYYLIQVYVPSILIVILSWVSFWLDIDAVPARISLGLLTVLTMTTQSAGARASLPKVSYIKGLDIWMAVCLIFVSSALIEFAYVNVFSRVENRRRRESMRQYVTQSRTENGHSKNSEPSQQVVFELQKPRPEDGTPNRREKARTLDRTSRIVFPIMFIVFNILYWCVFLFWTP